ncbi:PQQ-dependent sugar dehydrogenase [Rhodobacterales bacterium HKCCE3408]|nr:PQQ-dependent sugar dehydrogenase [Rhodobacterales bacterium HKCCE3408]
MTRLAPIAFLFALLSGVAAAETRNTVTGPVEITPVLQGLAEPWAVGFLPDGGFLVTLRDGGMLRSFPDGSQGFVSGLPAVQVEGQGGLLDVMVPRDFAETGEIFLTYAAPQGGRGAGTALARGVLDGTELTDVETLWQMNPGSSGGRHFGSRVVEGPEGHLFVTVGERGDRDAAQDLRRENGSVIRLNRDGTIPEGNPFIGAGDADPAIWSYGHRNPQGAALDAVGQLFVVEHGARGGDEINRIEPGLNYGWPIIAYGEEYAGGQIGIGTEGQGLEQPLHFWDPSIAPSGLAIYDGDMFPEWQGDLLVGALAFDLISRVDPDSGFAEVERIQTPETQRVRDVRVAPDGSVWFLSVGNGTLYRISRPGM